MKIIYEEDGLEVTNEIRLEPDSFHLVSSTNLGEDFDFKAEYKFVGRFHDRLVGIIAYRMQDTQDGKILPRFIHIIVSDFFRHSRTTIKFLRMTEKILKANKYNQSMAYIDKREDMAVLAVKFGYRPYAEDRDGTYYIKNIGA